MCLNKNEYKAVTFLFDSFSIAYYSAKSLTNYYPNGFSASNIQ